MRRVPVDKEFGPPIAALRNSPIVLFDNGTIAKINEPEDNQNPLLFNHYKFYFEDVSQISHMKLNTKDQISPTLEKLISTKFKIFFTVLLSIILLLSYQLSVDYSKLPVINSEPIYQIMTSLVIFCAAIGFEQFIYDHYTKNTFQNRSLQLHLVHRIEPKIILEEPTTNWLDFFDIHNASTRFAIILSCIYIPTNKDFNVDFLQFVKVLLVSNLMIYIFIISFSPLIGINFISKKRKEKDFTKVKQLEIEEFHLLAEQTIDSSRPNHEQKGKKTLSELLSGDENHMLEFKGSVWTAYNPKTYQVIETQTKKRDDLQDAVVKSIASFLNTDGGTLLIGVKDKPHLQDNPIIGIENDFKWVGKKDLEGFGHALIQLLNDAFGDQSTLKLYVEISYPTTDGKTICRIDIDPLPRIRNGELWVKTKTLGAEEFFYRVSDTTTHASAKSALRYIRHHFEGFSDSDSETND